MDGDRGKKEKERSLVSELNVGRTSPSNLVSNETRVRDWRGVKGRVPVAAAVLFFCWMFADKKARDETRYRSGVHTRGRYSVYDIV